MNVGVKANLVTVVVLPDKMLKIAHPGKPVPEDVPFTIDMDQGVHFRPERGGSVVAGGHF